MDISAKLSFEFKLKQEHVKNIVSLIDDGNTIPFIARYRKEMTGACDDQVLRAFSDRLEYVRGLDKRKAEVRDNIEKQGKLTPELTSALDTAATLAEVEDIYRPYKQKRRTRATIAKEKGLEPLALTLLGQSRDLPDIYTLAGEYIDSEKGVASADDACLHEGQYSFPLMVKPLYSHEFKKAIGGKYLLAADMDELLAAYERASAHGLEVVLLEVVPGDDDLLCSYYTYIDEYGEPQFHFTKRIIRRYPEHEGFACYHVTDWNPEVQELGLRLFRHPHILNILHIFHVF
jgi:hypothetical protein